LVDRNGWFEALQHRVLGTSYPSDLIAAAKCRKHVLLDKPIALNTQEATEMVQVADEAGIVFQMAYLIRYLPPYKKARQLIADGVVGKPLTMKIGIRCPLNFIRDSPEATEPGWYTDPKRGGAGLVRPADQPGGMPDRRNGR
jgi:predicted dehydrogenase